MTILLIGWNNSHNLNNSSYRYASEGIKAACDWAYRGAAENSVLQGEWHAFIFSFL